MRVLTGLVAVVLLFCPLGCLAFVDLDALTQGGGDGGITSDSGGTDANNGDTDAQPTYVTEVLRDRPLAYWRLGDAPDAGEVRDHATGAFPCTVAGAILGAPGALSSDDDTAASFAEDTRLRCGDTFGFAGRQSFTLEAWTLRQVSNGWVLGRVYGAGLRISEGAIELRRADAQTQAVDFVRRAAPLVAQTYSHVVGTYDAPAGILRLYVNFGDSSSAVISAPSTMQLTLGDVSSVGGFVMGQGYLSGFRGSLDEVAVYDYPLAEDRIRAHYAAAGR